MAIGGTRVTARAVTGDVEGNVAGNVNGNVVGSILGQIVQFIKTRQIVSVTIGSSNGTYSANMTPVTLAKTILIPLAHFVSLAPGAATELANWDFTNQCRVQVDLIGQIPGSGTASPGTAKVLVVEFY